MEWANELTPWEQDLFARCARGPLSETDVEEVAKLLTNPSVEEPESKEFTLTDIPGAVTTTDPLSIQQICEVVNVNALSEGQVLAFSETGLNVVYGRNGAGKTGYSRVLKHVGRSLNREEVLGNVLTRSSDAPSATIHYGFGSENHAATVDFSSDPDGDLARICVFDSSASRSYVRDENEIDYLPGVLGALRDYVGGLDAIKEILDQKIADVEKEPMDLTAFPKTGEVRDFLESISKETTGQEIDNIANLSDEEATELAKLKREKAEIESQQAPALRESASRDITAGKALKDGLADIQAKTDEKTMARFEQMISHRDTCAEALKEAADDFKSEPVAGIGGGKWRLLWDAAQAFGQEHDCSVPPEGDEGHCPLCLQELDEQAASRLRRFDEFVKNNLSQQLDKAGRAIDDFLRELPELSVFRATHSQILNQLGGRDSEPAKSIYQWLNDVDNFIEKIRRENVDSESPELDLEALETWLDGRDTDHKRHQELEEDPEQKRVAGRLEELEAKQAVAEIRDTIVAYRDSLVEKAHLEDHRNSAATGSVSSQITRLTKQFVSDQLKTELVNELKQLGFGGLDIEPTVRTISGVAHIRLAFSDSRLRGVDLASVLSEGQQRRVSLALFMVEQQHLPAGSPIVLDDPVTSLDQEGRRHIAKSLAAASHHRQVIVFTHDLSSIRELERQSDFLSAEITIQHVVEDANGAGQVKPSLPWDGLTAKDRLGALRDRLVAMRAEDLEGNVEAERERAASFCKDLRGAFERAVEDDVFGQVVTRRVDDVQTSRMKDVVLDDPVPKLVEKGMSANSPWVHDRTRADGSDPPTLDELEEGLNVLGDLLEEIKKVKKARQREAEKRKTETKKPLRAAIARPNSGA
ncbi:MAG: AAA family ATPase [Solirubrobacterales bacterium]|nr:AAA family ATPase [Solirubrobacterales bacterium]